MYKRLPWVNETDVWFMRFQFTCHLRLLSAATSTRFTSPTRLVSSSLAEEATKSSQRSKKYMVIGLSAFGGVLALVIIALIIMKVVCRRQVSPTILCQQTEVKDEIHVNQAFEMSDMPTKT